MRTGGERPRGMTLIEIMVSMSVSSLVILTTISVMTTTSDHMKFEMVVTDQQVKTRAALDGLMEELRHVSAAVGDFDTDVGVRTNTLSGANGLNTVTFSMPEFDNGTLALKAADPAKAVTYRWTLNPREAPNNGIDDDGNGLTDEDDGRLERLVGSPPSASSLQIVLDHVPRSSFQVVKAGRQLELQVGKKDNTPLNTEEGTRFKTVISHRTYCLRNY